MNQLAEMFVSASKEKTSPKSNTPLTPDIPDPYEKQGEFIDAIVSGEVKRGVLLWGRRAGKTIGMSILAAEAFKLGWRVLYATPTNDQLERFWYAVRRYFADDIASGKLIKNETRHLLERPGADENAPRIRAKTAWSSDTLRGDWGTLILLDEYQLMKDSLDDVVMPMLLDTGGTILYAGTPPRKRLNAQGELNQLRVKHDFADTRDKWHRWHIESYDNPHLDAEALEEIKSDLTGLGEKREIKAQFTDEDENALWSQKLIDDTRRKSHPPFERAATAVDPPSWTGEAGIVSGGMAMIDGVEHYYVTRDDTAGPDPVKWSNAAITAYNMVDADCLVYERNQGGKMVAHAIQTAEGGESIPLQDVWASKGKTSRAAPVAILHSNKRIHFVGDWPELEAQLTTYVDGDKSPDRMDAFVWLITWLARLGQKNNAASSHRAASGGTARMTVTKNRADPSWNNRSGKPRGFRG